MPGDQAKNVLPCSFDKKFPATNRKPMHQRIDTIWLLKCYNFAGKISVTSLVEFMLVFSALKYVFKPGLANQHYSFEM